MPKGTILHVITGTAIGGAEMMLLRYLRSCDPGRHLVATLMPRGRVADMLETAGIGVVDLHGRRAADLPAVVARLARLTRRHRPAVVHGWMYHGCLAATLALIGARATRTGLVWGIHHSLADPGHEKRSTRAVLAALRRLAPRADAITYCSREAARQHQAAGFPEGLARFVPNAIPLDEFRPDPAARARLQALAGLPPGRWIIGGVGRAHPMKDHAAFARALALLAGRGIDVHGVLIGAGQSDGVAVRIAAESGIADRLAAFEARDDIAALAPGFDLYLLSSAWGEALPLAVAEAMAAGVPAVVTDVGDCGWLVGETGRVCPPRRPDLLADACEAMLAMRGSDRPARALACRHRVAQLMSMNAYADHHAALYAAAAARRGAPAGAALMGRAA